MTDPVQKPAAKVRPRKYEAPAVVHEELIESVAVACLPGANPGVPVKRAAGDPNPMSPSGICENGFLNS